MNDVAEFLKARLDEDEAMAQAANGPRWAPGDGNISEGGLYAVDQDGDGWTIAWFELGTANEAADGGRQLPRWPKMERHAHSNSVHAARHDPDRVLREVAAKRVIMDQAEEASALGDLILRALASAYADHKDFQSEWRYDA